MSLKLPPTGSRGINLRAYRFFVAFNKLSVWFFRHLGGGSAGRAGLLLTAIGAKSGEERTVALGKFYDDQGNLLIVGSLAGAARHPAWLINLAKNPDRVSVEIGRERFRVRPEILTGEDRASAWKRIAPGYQRYQTMTDREIPLVRLVRVDGATASG